MVNKLAPFINKNKKKVNLVIVSPSAPKQEQYKPLLPSVKAWYPEMNEDTASDLFEISERNFRSKRKKQLIFVIDDLGESSWMKRATKNNRLNELVVTARHNNVHLVFLFQRLNQATPSVRDNADIIISFPLENREARKQFHKQFAGDLTEKQFDEISRRAWGKGRYSYLKIDRRNPYDPEYFEGRSGKESKVHITKGESSLF